MNPNYATDKDTKFWDAMENCPAVYVEGFCVNEGKPNAKAGWGLRYGRKPSQTVGGEVIGLQSAFRGRILGAIAALEYASEQNFDKLVINTSDNDLMVQFHHREKRATGNENLWAKLDFLNKKFDEVSLEHMFVDDRFFKDGGFFTHVTEKAKHFASQPSKSESTTSAASGDSNNNLRAEMSNLSGTVTGKVHITSEKSDDQNLRAEYKLEYGAGHPGNRTGVIHGELALQVADLTALQKSLENAIHTSTRSISITTDSKYIIMVDKFRQKWKRNGWKYLNGSELLNKKMIVLVDTLMEKFDEVNIKLVEGPRYLPFK